MGFNSTIYKKALDRLHEKKLAAEKAADARRAEICEKIPRVRELEKGISSSGIRAARAVIGGGNAGEELEKLRRENLQMQSELRELLIQNGYSENVLEPDYACKKCGDTGYYDEGGRTLVCSCLKAALSECACEELNRHAPLSLSTFESFSLDFYPQTPDSSGIIPRQHIEKVFKYCKSYAANFTPDSNSILMIGATGLGKTHLSLAIANEVIRRGYSVIYVSAPALLQKVDAAKRFRSEDESVFDTLNDCDLLIIDDLGTEYHSQYNVSNMYNIINSRLLSNKPLIISTNLTISELDKTYTDRFVSRMTGSGQKLNFMGTDIRVLKKKINL